MSSTVTMLRVRTYEESLALRVHAGYTPPDKWKRRMACTGLADHPRLDLLCVACPVRLACLTMVMAGEQHLNADYIVGHAAVSADVRRRLRLPKVREFKCGSNAGYVAHHRDGEDPCEPRKAAHATAKGVARYDRQRRTVAA